MKPVALFFVAVLFCILCGVAFGTENYQISGAAADAAPGDVEIGGNINMTSPGAVLIFPNGSSQSTAAVFPSCSSGEMIVKTSNGWGCVSAGLAAISNGMGLCIGNNCSAACYPGFGNCNNSYADGCESNLLTDPNNCSACGSACSVLNAAPACANGTCGIGQCNTGWGNCSGSPATGCETDTTATPQHCGQCGSSCSSANGTPGCLNSACTISCNNGFGNCNNNVADGCESNLLTDPNNCSACGSACFYPMGIAGCSGGVCQLAGCQPGWGNCDNNPANGCERSVIDVNNCGSCGNVCTPKYQTTGVTCGGWPIHCSVTSCTYPYADCNGNYSDGCETNLTTDSNNCMSCGNVCTGGKTCKYGGFNYGCYP